MAQGVALDAEAIMTKTKLPSVMLLRSGLESFLSFLPRHVCAFS